MLIEFKVTNFRSILKTQTLSLVSGTGGELKEQNTFSSGLLKFPNLLKSAVIYGANAAGKTSLIRAMQFMQSFVLESQARQEGQPINLEPFLFNSKSKLEPSEFEVIFIQDGVRYQYGFSANRERVFSEWLIAYPKNRPQRWFERDFDSEKEKYDWSFGSKFASPVKLRGVWRQATRQNSLFLSTAIQLNNEKLKPVFNWFQRKFYTRIPVSATGSNFDITVEHCKTDSGKKKVLEFMNAADLNIQGVELKKIKVQSIGLSFKDKDSTPTQLVEEIEVDFPLFFHKTDTKELGSIDFLQESSGTQRFFSLAGVLLDVLENGRIMVVDELDTSLHPHMMKFLIGTFHDQSVNKKGAQLIFTTHDTSLLDADNIFRRDQVWFVEKDKSGATNIYPLSDFSPRQNGALEKGYLVGRYGALPFMREFKL